MAFRAQFSETVVSPLGSSGGVVPMQGIAATVYVCNSDGSDGAQAPAYVDASSTTLAGLSTDVFGRVSFYLDPGNYNIHFDDQQSPPRISPFVRAFASLSVLSSTEISTLNSYISDLQFTAWKTYGLSNPQSESVFSTSYSTLGTPDSIPNVDVSGLRCLIGVWYHAILQETVPGDARAAIFIDNNQLVVPSAGGPVPQAAAKLSGSSANVDTPISTYAGGLTTFGTSRLSYFDDAVGRGQAQALDSANDFNAPTGLAVTLVLGGPASSFASGLYYWMVTAIVNGVETGPSNEASYNYFAPGPRLALSWNAVAGATSYNVYRSTVSGGEATSPALVASGVGTNSYIDTGSAVASGAIPAFFGPHLSYDLNGTVYSSGNNQGGPCWIFLSGLTTGGIANVSVQYLVSSGNASVRNRVLRVASIPFPL